MIAPSSPAGAQIEKGLTTARWGTDGFLQDPAYFPDRVRFQPVTSVPYWDERCGMTFASLDAFHSAWAGFWETACRGEYRPRDYVVENLTLESCAEAYMRHVRDVCDDCVGRR